MKKITPVPNGPLVKKKGPYAGSTLKSGGKIKKAANGTTTKKTTVKPSSEYITQEGKNYTTTKKVNTNNGPRYYQGSSSNMEFARELASNKALKINDSIPKAKLNPKILEMLNKKKTGGKIKKLQNGGGGKAKKEYVDRMNTADSLFAASDRQIKDGNYLNMISNKPDWNRPALRIGRENREKAKKLKNKKPLGPTRFKAGGMIKRADGSYSKRGLWDNIRANKGSGKKPTKQMLQQEKKIKAKTKK